jgi:hypothetical protein
VVLVEYQFGGNKKLITNDMKLVELIKYLTHPEQIDELYREQELNTESEALLIYFIRGFKLGI